MVVLSGFFGTFVLGAMSTSAAGISVILAPVAMTAFAVPMAGTVPLTIIAASI